MNKLKILFVGMYPDNVNKYRNVFFQNLIYAMADAGVDCTVISPIPITKYRLKTFDVPKHKKDVTPNGSVIDVYYPRYISLSSKSILTFNTGIFSEILFERCVLKQIEALNSDFDVVYGHFFLAGGLAAIKVGNKYSIPSIVAYGECDYDTEICSHFRELNEEDIYGLTGIVSVSENNKRILLSKNILNDIPILVAPNAIDLKKFYKRDKRECRNQLKIPQDIFVVGFVGGFIERKGDKRLLKAINQMEDVYVAFAGKGEILPKGEKVVFCESLPHNDVPVFLNAVDVFCLPTLAEGSCNAIAEAAACCLPIISSDLPFNDDLLNKNNSIRVNPVSITEIKEAVNKLHNDIELRDVLANKIYKDVQRFSIDARCKNIIEFIKKLIDKYNYKSN